MPTSYTSLLGLALPVTGELAGTWGDTVNDYITKYLDASVAGTQTISGSQTAVTLSVTNGTTLTQVGSGATGSAQYNIINCTGNPASLLTITAPAASKTYLIINATSTSQSVKIVGTGPTTGVTLIAGEKALVAWNGSDFIKVATTAAAAGSNTQVQYNSGGNLAGSANLTFDGTNLTLGGGTANGVAYLNGSKVLTTGSALSFDGTNFTAPRTQIATAGSPPASGAGLEILGGTSPLLFAYNRGTSAYLPLNATASAFGWSLSGSDAMVLTSTGLGIGTSSPATQFVVSNAGAQGVEITGSNGSIQVYNRSTSAYGTMNLYANTLYFRTGVSPAINMALDSSGNLGIGTTSINSRLVVQQANNTADGIRLYASSNDSQLITRYLASIDAWQVSASYASTGAYKPIAWFTSDVERMRLDSSGNLGIGTSSPAVKLDVSGADGVRSRVIATSGGTSGLILSSAGNTAYTIKAGNADNSLRIDQDGTDRLTLASGGNLGIGTSSPAYKLDVVGPVQSSAGYYINGNTSGGYVWVRDNYALRFGTNDTERMRLDSSGNLGIGTSSPVAKLDINGNQSFSDSSFIIGYGLNTQTGTIAGATSPFYGLNMATFTGFSGQGIGLHGYYGLLFSTTGTERARITSGGNLLVKTTADNGVTCHFNGGANANIIRLTGASTTNSGYIGMDGDNFTISTGASILERARITSGGLVLIATSSSADNSSNLQVSGNARASGAICVGGKTNAGNTGNAAQIATAGWLLNTGQNVSGQVTSEITSAETAGANPVLIMNRTGSAGTAIQFRNAGTTVGDIVINSASTTYNTSSDYRLKNITGPVTDSGSYIDSLKPVQGTWKADGSTFVGLIAHEAQEVSRTTVATGVKDGEQMQSMDYGNSEFIANIIAELQSLRARVAALETK